MQITIDDEFRSHLRRLKPDELATLEAQLVRDGCRDPFAVWKNGKGVVLLDGHHRFELCRKHSIPFDTEAIQLADRQAAIDWIEENQEGRRNLTPDEVAYYRGRRYERTKRQQGGTGANQYVQTGKTFQSAEQIAAKDSVTARTVRNDAAFARAVDAREQREPGFRQKVLSGELNVPRSQIVREHRAEVDRTPKPKQHNLLTTEKPVPDVILLSEWANLTALERHAALQAPPRGGFNLQVAGDEEEEQKRFGSIEWAKRSWNPVTGCKHNCPYCYARDIAERFYPHKFVPALIPHKLLVPQTCDPPESATTDIGEKNVFTCSMADLFGKWVPREWIDAVLASCRAAPRWNFLLLTKFPSRLTEFEFPDNCWIGTTVDCQARVAAAEKAFRSVKAKFKWLSCEPLIEPLKFTSLEMFNWLVIGGASRSSQTPEYIPPTKWLADMFLAADRAGIAVYLKTNARPREYPSRRPTAAPDVMRYLPTP